MKTCPDCGYTLADAKIHMDHHLCKNKGFFDKKLPTLADAQSPLMGRIIELESENAKLREQLAQAELVNKLDGMPDWERMYYDLKEQGIAESRAQVKGGWRLLEPGETIAQGDQIYREQSAHMSYWIDCKSFGSTVGDTDALFRRRISLPVVKESLNAGDKGECL